jgi:Alpha/beta hydrolase domain
MVATSARLTHLAITTIAAFALFGGGAASSRPLSAHERALVAPNDAPTALFVDGRSEPFGTFGGISFRRHTGFFAGITSLGNFRVPYEIVVPEDPALGNRTVVVEPPHFALGLAARDLVLTRGLLFGNGFSYAAVGFGTNGLNILDPTATGLIVAGAPVTDPGTLNPFGVVDEEILVHFARALTSDPFAASILGAVEDRYAYGISQTAAVLLETLHGSDGQGLFDLTILHTALWNPPFEAPGVFQNLPVEFRPLPGVGRVLFVESEGDQIVSDAEQFRRAAGDPDYRVYEVAGAAHLPWPTNPLDHFMVARALFTAGDRWVHTGIAPPPSTPIEFDANAGVDPVYADQGLVTHIRRDADGNAVGGVRLPDVEVGRAQFIAADFSFEILPGLAGLVGAMVDLTCKPEPGDPNGEPRFNNHGDYVHRFVEQANELRDAGFLLANDAELLKEQASASAVGKTGSCASATKRASGRSDARLRAR